MREVGDQRIHGTTGERPIDRFHREEAKALKDLKGKAPFLQLRELVRRVHHDACIELESNRYCVPWRLIGCRVSVAVGGERVRISYAGQEVASHERVKGRRQRIICLDHLKGIVGTQRQLGIPRLDQKQVQVPLGSQLLRPLSVYQDAVEGDRP